MRKRKKDGIFEGFLGQNELSTDPNHNESFLNAEKGFIAPLSDNGVIKNANGDVVWDLGNFSFIKKNSASPDTVNPSLWRQSQLVSMGGLYQVNEQIYQVRTADLSNITFIEGPQSIIIVDPLISTETAKASLDLYFQHRPKKPIVAGLDFVFLMAPDSEAPSEMFFYIPVSRFNL